MKQLVYKDGKPMRKVKIKALEERNKKLSKRHPTKEEAIAQFHFLRNRSKRKEL
jgi:hypothetical protein